MSIGDLKSRLADVPGIEGLTMQLAMGRQIFGLNGKLIGVDANADDAEIERAIRAAIASDAIAQIIPSPSAALLPSLTQSEPQGKSMAAPTGGFAASIKAMLEEARAGVEKAKADGMAKVGEAVTKLNQAQAATAHVAGSMAKTIEDEASAVMSELGQISNDLGLNGEAG